ncbi:MAG: AraC family transcriptional regulator ligand-binding domain-containing protein [Desulfobacterales bacterium]|nr:AraC family transcriptional regulator ligand-binding domain-containing protein [Desulfobacterales bacterium]
MKQASHFSVQRGWKIILIDMGINPADVLALAGLPADLFSRVDAVLSPNEYFNLWLGLEQIAGVEELPLKIGQAISVEAFDPPIFASLCSPNLNTALMRLAEHKRLICPMVLTVDIGSQQTRATLNCSGYDQAIPRSLGATELVFFTQLARMATREKIMPVDLELPRLPDHMAPYEEFFGRPIRFGNAVRITFSARDAVRPFLTEDATMWDFFEVGLKKRLSDLDTETGIAQRVKSALLEMLPGGHSSIEEAASRLSMSKRTLQRHLSRERSSFQEILNTTRKELAQHYLARSTISPPEISYLLGYQDANSFLRAFRGWTGSTPGEFRVEHISVGLLH